MYKVYYCNILLQVHVWQFRSVRWVFVFLIRDWGQLPPVMDLPLLPGRRGLTLEVSAIICLIVLWF